MAEAGMLCLASLDSTPPLPRTGLPPPGQGSLPFPSKNMPPKPGHSQPMSRMCVLTLPPCRRLTLDNCADQPTSHRVPSSLSLDFCLTGLGSSLLLSLLSYIFRITEVGVKEGDSYKETPPEVSIQRLKGVLPFRYYMQELLKYQVQKRNTLPPPESLGPRSYLGQGSV